MAPQRDLSSCQNRMTSTLQSCTWRALHSQDEWLAPASFLLPPTLRVSHGSVVLPTLSPPFYWLILQGSFQNLPPLRNFLSPVPKDSCSQLCNSLNHSVFNCPLTCLSPTCTLAWSLKGSTASSSLFYLQRAAEPGPMSPFYKHCWITSLSTPNNFIEGWFAGSRKI